MLRKTYALVAASALALMVASPASAAVFTFTIGGGATGAGTLTTGDTPNNNGGYLVNAITGTLNGSAITGLIAPGGYGGNNNRVFPFNPPLVNASGLSFLTTGAVQHNIYWTGTTYRLYLENDVTFTVTPAATGAVPEPATWGLLVLGMGMIGAGLRTRRRTVSFSVA